MLQPIKCYVLGLLYIVSCYRKTRNIGDWYGASLATRK